MAGRKYAKRTYKQSMPAANQHNPSGYGVARVIAAGVTTAGLMVLKKQLGLNTENKNYDLSATATTTTTLTGILAPTTSLVQGLTNNTREGNSLRITHWNIRMQITKNILQTVGASVRIIICYQGNCQQGQLVASQLLQNTSLISSPYNTDLTGVRILHDKVYKLESKYSGDSIKIFKNLKINPAGETGHVQWIDSDTLGLQANLTKGYYSMFCMADTIAGAAPQIVYYSRVNYVDN